MPGRLHVDWVPDGTYAFKPDDAAAYCEGALSEQRGDNPEGTPPPGLTSPASDLWDRGYADAAAGLADGACGLPVLGPEIIPDPYFLTWDGAANPNNFPIGWVLNTPTATNYFEPAAAGAGCHVLNADGGNAQLTIASPPIISGATYRVRWNVTELTSGSAKLDVGGIPCVIDSLDAGGCDIVAADASQPILWRFATPTDVRLSFLSLRQLL